MGLILTIALGIVLGGILLALAPYIIGFLVLFLVLVAPFLILMAVGNSDMGQSFFDWVSRFFGPIVIGLVWLFVIVFCGLVLYSGVYYLIKNTKDKDKRAELWKKIKSGFHHHKVKVYVIFWTIIFILAVVLILSILVKHSG